MDLDKVRNGINQIDGEMLKLLKKRMELAIQAGKFKKKIEDPTREKEILDKIGNSSTGIIDPKFSKALYQKIFEESKKLQKMKMKLIGFQGEHGAYSEVAVKSYDPKGVPIPCTEFSEIFEGVKSGRLDLGMVPVENTLAGPVPAVNDLLVSTDLHIIAEVRVPIHHCLLSLPETDYRDLKVAYSHHMALAQCRKYLSKHNLEARNFYDTAGAAKMLAEERPKAAAAIASKLCAEIYGLEILGENIEDHSSNTTRFLVLSREPSLVKGNKCSVIFSTQHKAGALFSVLEAFSDSGINLTRIESRPVRDDPGKFAFHLDFMGSKDDKKVVEALRRMKEHTEMFKFLGCYIAAK